LPARKIITILSTDDPISIDPSTMTHSIVIVEAGKADLQGTNHSQIVDEVQAVINPDFWPPVARQCAAGKISARNYLAIISTSPQPKVIEPVLKEMGVEEGTSVFLRNPTVSLDGGKTEQEVYALIVFRDSDPRIIISTREPLIHPEQPASTRRNAGESSGVRPFFVHRTRS
jgi:hypothetical protein